MRIGILGGTFDPIHFGHLAMAEEARVQLGLDQVFVVPAGRPWLKEGQQLSSAGDRIEMARVGVASNPHFTLRLDEVDRPGPTYTVDTLEALKQELPPENELFFILGLDAMEDFHRWKNPERLLELCQLVIVQRPGSPEFDLDRMVNQFPGAAGRLSVLSMPLMGISGTEIRRRAESGISLRYHLPDAVAEYIENHGLYAAEEDTKPRKSAAEGIRSRLLDVALERGALKYGQFTLTSGKRSSYYFDGRLLSLDPEGSRLISEALLPVLRAATVEAVGGLTLGADPIVSAIALASHLHGENIPAFIVRKETKTHGTGQGIEGPLVPGSRVAIIDDVCTTGGSLFQAIEAAEEVGCTVVKVAAILDRKEGGSDELVRRGYDFCALLSVDDEGRIVVV